MRFPLIVSKDDSSDYGALFPDVPGCYTMAATLVLRSRNNIDLR